MGSKNRNIAGTKMDIIGSSLTKKRWENLWKIRTCRSLSRPYPSGFLVYQPELSDHSVLRSGFPKSLTYLQNDVLTQTMGDRGCGTALVPTIPCINTQRLLDSGYFEIWNQWLMISTNLSALPRNTHAPIQLVQSSQVIKLAQPKHQLGYGSSNIEALWGYSMTMTFPHVSTHMRKSHLLRVPASSMIVILRQSHAAKSKPNN